MAMTVTATQGGATQAGTVLSVLLYANAAAPAVQASGGKTGTLVSGSNAAGQLAITPNATGSIIVGASASGGSSIYVANAATTMLGNVYNSSTPSEIAAFKSSATTTASTPVTIGSSSPTNGTPQVVLAEILASGGALTENTVGENSASVASTTATTQTTGSFTPNPGDLVVVCVASGGGNTGTTTFTVTNTGGLTFTTLVTSTASFYGCNAVYVAQMPGGTAPPQQMPQQGGLTFRRRFRKPQQPTPPQPPLTISSTGSQLIGTGSLIATPGTSGGAALDGAGSLIATGSSAGAALDAAGSLIAAGTQGAGTALDAAGSLTANVTTAPGASLTGTGAVSAGPGFAGAAALDAAGSLIAASTIAPAAALDAAGSMAAPGTISITAALQGIGTLAATGSAVGAALDGAGTLTGSATVYENPVQIARNSVTTGTTCTVTLSATTAGNTLVAVIYSGATALSGVTLGGSADNWASRSNVFNASVGVDAIWSDPVCAGGQTSVVVTQNASQAMAVIVYELPGNCVLDQVSAGNSSASGTTGWTSGTISATTQATEFWIGMVGGFNGAGTAASITTAPASPWNNQAILDFNTYAYLYTSWQYTSATGTPSYTGATNVTSGNNSYGATIATFTASVPGAAPLIGAGSLSTAAAIDPVAAIIAAGRLATSVIEQPGPITLAGAGRLVAGGTQGAPTALQGTGSLSPVGYSVNAALIGTGTLANSVIENSGAALDAAATFVLGATETPGPVTLTGTGTLSAIPGTSGGANLDGAGTLGNQIIQGEGASLTGTGSLIPEVTQAPGVILAGTGTLSSVGFAIGAALVGAGSVIANARLGITTLIAGAGSILTAAVQSPALEAFNFGTFPQIPNGSAITSVTVVINEWSSTSAMNAPSFELWDGTSAKIGTTQIGTPSTSPYNLDSATWTGVSYSQLATLRVRIYANAGSAVQGDQELANSVSLTVAFTPSVNSTATVSVLKEASTLPAVTVVGQHNATATAAGDIPAFTNFPAVTCGQLSNVIPVAALRCATVLPPVTAQGIINASITVATLALAGNVVASIVTATSTGPDYARAADIAAGIGTSVGTWTSVAGVIGPPDASEAVWTRP